MMKFEMKYSKHRVGGVGGIHANRTMQIGEYISRYMIHFLSLPFYQGKRGSNFLFLSKCLQLQALLPVRATER